MNERKFPLGLMVMVPVIAGFGLYAFTTQQDPVVDPNHAAGATATVDSLIQTAEVSGADATPTPADEALQTAIAADRTAIAALTPIEAAPAAPDAYATPTAVVRGQFREGTIARVNVGAGDCLNVRNRPGPDENYGIINTCLPDGFEGYLVQGAEGFDEATQGGDDRWWWLMAGHGWVAEEYLLYVRNADLSAATAPQLAGMGRIAYVREGDVWLMDADGGNQRTLIQSTDSSEYPPRPQDLRWSPDGSMLSYNIWRQGDDGVSQSADLHIVRLTGDGDVASDTVYRGLVGDNWSPDSGRMGIIKITNIDGMGGGYKGLPGVLDVTTGQERLFGTEEFAQTSPPAFNFDGTLLLVTHSQWGDGTDLGFLIWDFEGREVHRIAQPQDGWYGSPRWSPVENKIAFHASTVVDGVSGQPQYLVYDVAAGGMVAAADVPNASDKIGGRCGGLNMWRMEWTRDGAGILYSFDMGDTGANGVWSWDIPTGTQTLIPTFNAGHASAGAGGWFVFAVWGGQEPHIVIGHEDGGYPQPMAKGYDPAWWAPS